MNVVYADNAMAHWGRVIAEARGWPLFLGTPCGDDVDTVHIVGMYDIPHYANTLRNTAKAKRRVISWHGSDARFLSRPDVLPEATHVFDSQQIADHLATFGIEGTVIPVPTTVHAPVTALPDEPVVGCYLGDSSRKYNQQMCLAVAESLPTVGFHFYSAGTFPASEMPEVIAKTSVFLRLTHFEGSCVSAREYKEAGRPVVGGLPFATHKVDVESLESCVRGVRRALKDGRLPMSLINEAKAENAVETYNARMGEL